MLADTIAKYKWWLLLIILLGGLVALLERWQTWRENSQDLPILAAARQYQVEPALVKAVVWRESRFNPRARGSKKERGLMQIRQPTAEDWVKQEHPLFFTPDQLFDPAKNTLIGAWYLKKLLARYQQTDNPLVYALADYNAGRTHVLRWNKGAAATNSAVFLGQMDFPGTRDYVRAVLKRYERYRRVFPTKPPAMRHATCSDQIKICIAKPNSVCKIPSNKKTQRQAMKLDHFIPLGLLTSTLALLGAGCVSSEVGVTSPYHPGPGAGKALGTGVGVVAGNAAGAVVGVGEGLVGGAAAPFNNTTRKVRRWHTETTPDGRTIQVHEDILVDEQGRVVGPAPAPVNK